MSSWWHNVVPRGFKKKLETEPSAAPGVEKVDEQKWIKLPDTGELVTREEIEAALWVTPGGFHMRIGAKDRFRCLFDGDYRTIPLPKAPTDPLKFRDDKKYVDRLRAARTKTGAEDCMSAAEGTIGGAKATVLVQDFDFMGGSLGMAAGEAFITAALYAARKRTAFVAVTASGGARMQEGVLSLMQMPRTTLAIQELHEAGLPYIVILTDPTSGGVTASYAMLGDVQIAEPGAMIAFSGPRVIEQTIRQKLPEGFQRAEYLLEKGMVDMVVSRDKLRGTVGLILSTLMAGKASIHREPELPFPVEEEVEKPPVAATPAAARRRAAAQSRTNAAE